MFSNSPMESTGYFIIHGISSTNALDKYILMLFLINSRFESIFIFAICEIPVKNLLRERLMMIIYCAIIVSFSCTLSLFLS